MFIYTLEEHNKHILAIKKNVSIVKQTAEKTYTEPFWEMLAQLFRYYLGGKGYKDSVYSVTNS